MGNWSSVTNYKIQIIKQQLFLILFVYCNSNRPYQKGRKQSSHQQSVRYYKIHFYLHIYCKIWCIKAFDKNCRNQAHLQTQKKRKKIAFWGTSWPLLKSGGDSIFWELCKKYFYGRIMRSLFSNHPKSSTCVVFPGSKRPDVFCGQEWELLRLIFMAVVTFKCAFVVKWWLARKTTGGAVIRGGAWYWNAPCVHFHITKITQELAAKKG